MKITKSYDRPVALRPLEYLVVGVLALGIAGYVLSVLLFGWHF
jgi:hypothetical protein